MSNHVTRGRKTLSDHTRACPTDIRKLLLQNPPRRVESTQAEVLHIYVDASFDYDCYSGLGGLIINMSEKVLSFFSAHVAKVTLDDIMAKGQTSVVQELEMMAVLAAVWSWKE